MKGYLKTLKSVKFVLNMLYMKVILGPLGEISEHLQKNLLYVGSCLKHTYDLLDSISKAAAPLVLADDTEAPANTPSAALTLGQLCPVLLEAETNPRNVYFKGVHLNSNVGSVEATVQKFRRDMVVIAGKVEDCIISRFRDLGNNLKLSCLKLLNCQVWPRDPNDLLTFGNDTLQVFTDEFSEHGELLVVNSVEADELIQEFAKLKVFWLANLWHLPQEELWPLVLKDYASAYPNLINVWQIILLVIPVSNAIVERGFSTMGCVKTYYRNRLST